MQVLLFILLCFFSHFGPYVLAPLFNSSFEIRFFVQIVGHMRLVEQVQKSDDIPGGILLVLFRKLRCESRVRQCFYPVLHMAAAMK